MRKTSIRAAIARHDLAGVLSRLSVAVCGYLPGANMRRDAEGAQLGNNRSSAVWGAEVHTSVITRSSSGELPSRHRFKNSGRDILTGAFKSVICFVAAQDRICGVAAELKCICTATTSLGRTKCYQMSSAVSLLPHTWTSSSLVFPYS